MKPLQSLITASVFAVLFAAITGQATADDTYPHAVLLDNPIAYYQFEETVGSTQAIDSSPNGNDSVFVGSRNLRKSFDFGYEESPGLNTVFGVGGRVGNAIELLNADSAGWENALCPDNPFPSVVQECIDYEGGGYIETGVTLDINDDDTNPATGFNPIDWSVEISILNPSIAIGPTTFEEYIITQRQFGDNDVQILTTLDLNGNREGPLADKAYASFFGETTSNATETPYDVNTPETNAGNLLTYQGEWETLVLTFEASTNTTRWYSQGQLIKTEVLVDPTFVSVDDSWFIGVNKFFNWQHNPSILVDEFSVYDYRLSDARILARYNAMGVVPPGLLADFDNDNDVDGNDFLEWQRGFGTLYDATDLANWESEFGTSGAALAAATGAVPEPSSAVLLFLAACTLAAGRRGCLFVSRNK